VKVASASTGSWLQSLMILFTKEYIPISLLRFLAPIFRSWSSLLRYHGPCNLSPTAFHARSPKYALKRVQMHVVFLRCPKVSRTESLVWFANLAAVCCTCYNAFIWPSLDGSPSTQSHIQEFDAPVTWNEVLSRLFFANLVYDNPFNWIYVT